MIETSHDVPKDLKTCNRAHIAPHIGVQDYFDISDTSPEYFDDKKITDIGGGAGLLDLYIQNNAKPQKIIIVEPDLKKRSYEDIVKRAKGSFDRFSKGDPKWLEGKKEQLRIKDNTTMGLYDTMEYAHRPHECQGEIDILNNETGTIRMQVQKMEKHINNQKENVEIFDKFLTGEYKGVELNDSSGEKIIGIDEDSQDVVFINHLLHKLSGTYYDVLKEADRILNPTGEIIIIEYAHHESYGDFFRQICDEAGVINKEEDRSMCIKLKKGEYVKLQSE